MDDLELMKKKIFSIGGLPTLPQVASDVLSLAGDPNSSMKDISAIIHKDPSLAGKVLKIANSAFYGLRQQVGSLHLALVVLGLRKITNLLTSVSVLSMFPPGKAKAVFDRIKFWEHSAGCGAVARIISSKAELKLDGEEFVSGLLHDVGKIILDQYFASDFDRILVKVTKDKISFAEAERQVIGASHATLGSWMAENWKLPPVIVAAIKYHHRVEFAPEEYKAVAAVVSLSNSLTRSKGMGVLDGEPMPDVETLPEWDVLEGISPAMASVDRVELLAELGPEIESAKAFVMLARD